MFGQWITSASLNCLASLSPVCALVAVTKLSTCCHQNSENKIFITAIVVGWEHSNSTYSCADFSPVCVIMAMKLKWHLVCLWISYHKAPPVLGFRMGSHEQPTQWPLLGHLLWLLACSWDIKLYPTNQSINPSVSWQWWKWAHVTMSPVEINHRQMCLLNR